MRITITTRIYNADAARFVERYDLIYDIPYFLTMRYALYIRNIRKMRNAGMQASRSAQPKSRKK
jgi:hypothetical protein